VVIHLELGADLHMAQLMPLPLTVSCFSKIQISVPFWYRLTWVVPDRVSKCIIYKCAQWSGKPNLRRKGPLNGCMYVCKSFFDESMVARITALTRSLVSSG